MTRDARDIGPVTRDKVAQCFKSGDMHQGNDFLLHPKLWKAYSRFPGRGDSEYELRCTCKSVEKAVNEYQNQLERWMRTLVIPEEWKTFAEETDALSSILYKSLKRYFDYLIDLSDLSKRPVPFLSYGGVAEIQKLRFPQPQIIPDNLDPLKYYTRLSTAMLHMFSYPGSTICRCEMDAERNTSLPLYSFFDWFGIIQPGCSQNEAINSIRIFKRNSHPQWIRHGFVPIVFSPRRLRTIAEHRRENYRFGDGQVPVMLIPLISAVEQTLKALLLYAIHDWKEKRTKDNEIFAIPDWLFIHGIIYDALEIDFYTFIPKILECDCNGVPSQWEFVCVPVYLSETKLFANRAVFRRANRTSALLAIQRQTRRICQVLDGLDPVSLISPMLAILESEIFEETHLSETAQCVAVDRQSEAAETATQCLSECIHRAGLEPENSSRWLFLNTLFDMDIFPALGPYKCFLVEFVDNWQSQSSGKISLPEDWFTPTYTFRKDEINRTAPHNLIQDLPKLLLQIWTSGRKDDVILLTKEELWRRHSDLRSFAPDFYLSTPARKERADVYHPIPLDNLCPDTTHSLEHFKDVFQYVSHESEAKMAISSPFMCTPGCWLKYDTESRFSSALTSESSPVDFSLLLHSVQTVPIEMTPLTSDVNLRATILNPALVVAIQGPALWPDELACSPALSCSRPKDKPEALRRLARAIEPSLKTHLINWQLRFEQGLTSTKDPPPWFMLFGIIYDAEEVTIVAHIPYMNDDHRYSFISCIVDTISFPPVTGSAKVSEPWFLDRFRVGLALLSLQKHAFRMAGLWECVVWPDELISWEEILEREYLGPVLTPAERGYMVEPHPMTQLYLKIHGSDETLDECSETSDGEEDGEEQSEEEEEEEEDDDDDDDDEQEEDQGDVNGNPTVDDSISLSRAIVEWRSQILPGAR